MEREIPLRLVELEMKRLSPNATTWVIKGTDERPKAGDCFYCPPTYMRFLPPLTRNWPGDRAPIVIVLPDGTWWAPEGQAYNETKGDYYGEGWEVTGALPNVTIRPSIRSPMYHGFVTDGKLVACGDSRC